MSRKFQLFFTRFIFFAGVVVCLLLTSCILILGLILIFSFLTLIPRYVFAGNQLKEIIPGNVNSLKKLLSTNGSTAVFLDDKQLELGSSQDNKIEIKSQFPESGLGVGTRISLNYRRGLQLEN